MTDAYHMGRKELLQWINESFGFGYERIEQTCTGACACQIVDSLFPGVVPMSKVNFEAKFDYEYIKNYKILQSVFTKLNIPKVIEVNKLIRGKYQDNLEFLQWLKKFYDDKLNEGTDAGYDAVSKRKAAIKEYRQTTKTTTTIAGSSQTNTSTLSVSSSISQRKPTNNLNTSINSTTSTNKMNNVRNVNTTRGGARTQIEKKIAAPPKSSLSMMQLRIENLERERDFYFQKLRDIELYTQAIEDNQSASQEQLTFMRDMQKILYATDEDFAAVDQNSDDEIMSDNNKENLISNDDI